jgi:hypothetical protein
MGNSNTGREVLEATTYNFGILSGALTGFVIGGVPLALFGGARTAFMGS